MPNPVTYTIQEGEIEFAPGEKEKYEEAKAKIVTVDNPDQIPVDDGLAKLQQQEIPAIRDNKFDDVIGSGYGQRFEEVMKANITDRFWLMSSIVSYANQDKSLSKETKDLVKQLEDSFFDACSIDEPCKRLFKILEHNYVSIFKMIYPTRLKRTYDSVNIAIRRLEFSGKMPDAKYIPTFFHNMAVSFSWETLPKYNNFIKSVYIKSLGFKHDSVEYSHLIGFMLLVLLSKYSNDLSPTDYTGMWFVLMFIKNLSVCSLVKPQEIEAHPELKLYADNLFQLVDHMIGLTIPEVYTFNEPSQKVIVWNK